MKNLKITVNGTTYDVQVEETGASSAPVASAPAPAAAPAPAPAAAPAPSAGAGTKVESPMPGTVLYIKVANGATVNEGDPVVILEAMKMENEICASGDGTVDKIVAAKGASVNSGDVLVTLK